MPIDHAKLGNVSARLMETLDQYGDDANISHVIVIAAIDTPGEDTVHFAVSEGMAQYVAMGLLKKTLNVVESGG
ncbi:MAG: hypothetical protein ACRDN6_01525 [Gaiellaceae bacterium]